MHNSAFSQRLALLPKLDTIERALSYVTAQKAYTKLYSSEGRAYLSSWQNESQSNNNNTQSENDNKVAEFSFSGTPILEPRVRKAAAKSAESVISVHSSRSGEHKRVKKIAKSIVSVSPSKSTEKQYHRQSRPKGKKHELSVGRVNKSKKPTKSKKRVNESPSDSSKADRLKERRERKRSKRAIMNPSSGSDKENEKEEKRLSGKKCKERKIIAGFALMHGFNATNVGKNRLTVRPSVNIGVFNKGKASVKTKAKASRKKDNNAGHFSETKFLNKTRNQATPHEETTSDSNSGSSSSAAVIKPLKNRPGARKTKDTACEVADAKISESPSSPPSKHRATSVVWDIELGKSLCNDVPFTSIAPVSKLGSVVLDVTRQSWAKQLAKGDTERERFDIVESLPNNHHSNCNNEVAVSIGPSQSASQMNISLANAAVQEEKRSKYFQDAPRKHEALHAEPLVPCIPRPSSPPIQEDVVHMSSTEGLAEGAVPVEDVPPIQSPEVAGGYIQEEPQYAEQSLADGFSFGDIDREHEFCPAAAPEHKSHLPYNAYDDIEKFEPLGEYDCSRQDDIFLPHEYEDLYIDDMDMDMDRKRELETEYNFCPGSEFCDDLLESDPQLGDPNGIIQDELEMDELCSYQQGEDEPDEVCGFEDNILISSDHDADSESIGQTPSESDEKEEQVHRFSQGRALLLGCSVQEVGHPGKTRFSFPRLSVLEADVAKSLRDHWHPQRL